MGEGSIFLTERIHPICAQSKPKVPYLSSDVLIEHSIDSPPVMTIGGVPHHCILRSSPCQRNSLADFAHANSLCTRGAIGKYQTTFMGPSLVLVPSSDGPFLYHGAFTLGALVQVFVFFSTVQYAIIRTRMDFFNLEADGVDHLLGQVCLF